VFSKGSIHSDGRIVLYHPAEIPVNVKNPRTAWVQGERVALGRLSSTIRRELRRNTVTRHRYLPHSAHRTSAKRGERPGATKIANGGPLHYYVAAEMAKRWSPE
jgi:hypothetical protein